MKKRIIIAVAFTACLALCAAVWPQPDTREERPAPIPTYAVTAPKADAATRAEKKNAETPKAEPVEELGAVPVPAPAEPTSVAESPRVCRGYVQKWQQNRENGLKQDLLGAGILLDYESYCTEKWLVS